MRKTNAELRDVKIMEHEDRIVAMDFIKNYVMPVIEKFDGKKISKRISTAIKKSFEENENLYYIGDIRYKTDYFNRIYGSQIHFGFEVDGRKFSYDLEIITDKKLPNGVTEENQYNHEGTMERLEYDLQSTRAKLEVIENFTVEQAKEIAKHVDSLMEEIKAISDRMNYEQREMVEREMKCRARYLPFQN